MNCQDIEEILDHCDAAARVGASADRGVLAHINGCFECARDWDLHARFASLPDARPPTDLAARCRKLVTSGPAAQTRPHSGRRHVLIGAIVAVSAAAAMLAAYQWRSAAPAGFEVPDVPAALLEDSALRVASGSTAADRQTEVAVAKVAPESARSPASMVPGFSVLVAPLRNDATDAAGQAEVESFYAAMLDQLRAIEGLKLVMFDPSDPRASENVGLQLLISGAGPVDGHFTGRVRAMRLGPGGLVQPVNGQFDAGCVDSVVAPSCFNARGLAASLVDWLRTSIFPADPALLHSMVARLQDARLDSRQRLKALQDLASPKISRVGPGHSVIPGDALRDSAVVRAAIELAQTAAEPAIRMEVWRRMRGIGDENLLRPLMAAGQLDPDRGVRIEAIRTLGADFATQPDALAALEAITQQESSPLVRAQAERGLKGEAAWDSYIVESLEDASRSDDERIEALLYDVSAPTRSVGRSLGAMNYIIDSGGIAALAEVLPRVGKSESGRDAVVALMSHLGTIGHPAITELLLASIEESHESWERRVALGHLAKRTGDVRVRAALSNVASGDPDPELRQMAESALREASAGKEPPRADP